MQVHIINIFEGKINLIVLLFQSERILSFIPPDGNFRLMSYLIGSQSSVAIPINIRHQISFSANGTGKLDITVSPRQTMGRTVSFFIYFSEELSSYL